MAKQSNLEKEGIETRSQILPKNDYNKDDGYSSEHIDALSNPEDKNKPLGKGSGHGGHGHYIPDHSKGKDAINYSNLDTFNGGGSYDIYGRNGIGGREYLININMYNSDNAYGLNSVDTTQNQLEGQYVVK